MRLFYDLHIHSCLSPCGDNDMTPYNLVNMAKISGLDIIALTDHNSAGNCKSAVRAGLEAGITVIPGMELCTAEEIHMVCLFEDCEASEKFGEYVKSNIPGIKNKPLTFGDQFFMDEYDNITGSEDILLVTASFISVNELPMLIKSYGGVCFPAHIDRSSYSIISSLGAIPPELKFSAAEISPSGNMDELFNAHEILNSMNIFTNSDAHYLDKIAEPERTIDIKENSAKALIDFLRRN